MKNLLFLLLLLCASRLVAQSPAGDPNAINFSAKMDTIARINVFNFNAGLLNADSYEDFLLGRPDGNALIRYGGPFIYDTTPASSIIYIPTILADLTGSGEKDIISSYFPRFHKRLSGPPYFDTLGTTIFTIHGGEPRVGLIGAIDCNEDRIDDLVASGGSDAGWEGVLIYHGSQYFADSAYKYPDDSLNLKGTGWNAAVIGSFSKEGKPMLFLSFAATSPDSTHVTTYKIGVLRHLNDVAHDTIVYLSHTTNIAFNNNDSMIVPLNMYATDITGDGITDLLVTDNARIYIFKGSDSLGYYPLTKKRAYYSIPSPRILDFTNYRNVDHFGQYMYACGDLSGSAVPYLMVLGEPDVNNFSLQRNAFFYAGGKALDSLYDAVVTIDNYLSFTMDTLHSIGSGGRSAVLLSDGEDYWGNNTSFDFLLYKEGDKIPHVTNPKLSVVGIHPTVVDSLSIRKGKNYVKLDVELEENSAAQISVFNVLGQQVFWKSEGLDPGQNVIYCATTDWPNGAYVAVIRTGRAMLTQKFLIHR